MNCSAPQSTAWRIERHGRIASTQTRAIACAEEGEAEGLAVLAAEQSQGRGSRGRRWESLRGNLHLSALLRPVGAGIPVSAWSMLAAVALSEALEPFVGVRGHLTLKHPNDLLLDGAKLAGILVDVGHSSAGELLWVVCGFGVNLRTAPEIPAYPTIALAEIVVPPNPEALAPRLLERLSWWYATAAGEGETSVRRAWLDRVPRQKDAAT